MVGIKNNKFLQEDLESLIPDRKLIEPELLRNFVTYWWVRKSHPFLSIFEIKEIKSSLSSVWLKIIESNHRFRNTYGDKKAEEIINIIQKYSINK